MANTPPQMIASGNINPFRFCTIDTGEEHSASEADANEQIIGIAGAATRLPPLSDLVTTNYAAVDGESFELKGDGEICLLTAGEAVTAGIRLKSDNDGKGVALAGSGTTIQNYGCMSLQASSAAGELILVQVMIGSERPAVA